MRQRDLMSKIRKELKNMTMAQLAKKLGYRSASTVLSWLKNEKVPGIAKEKVEQFFKNK